MKGMVRAGLEIYGRGNMQKVAADNGKYDRKSLRTDYFSLAKPITEQQACR